MHTKIHGNNHIAAITWHKGFQAVAPLFQYFYSNFVKPSECNIYWFWKKFFVHYLYLSIRYFYQDLLIFMAWSNETYLLQTCSRDNPLFKQTTFFHFPTKTTCHHSPLTTKTTYQHRLPVHNDHLSTINICQQKPPVYNKHLPSKTTCQQRPPVYNNHLSTKITYPQKHESQSLQIPPVHKGHLSTKVTCPLR